ncbi:inverted formin-2 isoform X2 [Tribolium madens]|nr:inverted formin-2 isoform X2 [Tribolium madens]XP_044263151.1 inverted formin-2 isoform X2 [Tribolium madens]
MDSRIGLDFIVENPEYIRKLAAALDTNNVTVKKQVFELLSALCVHNEEGHARALDTLEHYKKLKGERYRLNVIVQELSRATAVDYQTALVAFINCLIISTPRLTDRIRRRNEFIGCHLLPVLNNLRKCAEAEPELAVQLDVFDEQRDSDDSQSLQGPHGVDLNSPLDVFYAILKQVAETPQEIPFLSILQHLLRIDPKEAVSDIIWDTAERLVHRATLLENREDAARLLRAPSAQSKFFCHCHLRSESSPTRRQSLNTPQSPTPAPMGQPLPPPPPPPPNIPAPPSIPPPIPAPPLKPAMPNPPPPECDSVIEKLPQQEIPAPKIKMKTFNWNKIPNNKVIGKNNIWTQVAYSHQNSPMADLDWLEMEGLFCQQTPPTNSSASLRRETATSDTLDRRIRKENCEITLLDGKRSLNVNIFLKQFRSSNEDIIHLIREGEHDDIGAEKLKGLLKILPEVDELDMLKSFDGDFSKLGNAEKFLIQLTNLSNYKLRIESMLLKEEFASNMSYLEPSIKSMIMAAQDLMTNKPLQEVLYMILVAGNFLNAGGYAGNAAGVKLSSLQKITDIRANKPNMNLIHFVALQAEKKNSKLLTFTDNISVLEDAAKTTVEQLQNEINVLDVRIKKIKKQIELPTTEPEIKNQMTEFLQMAEREVSNLQQNMVELEKVRVQLAEFFCEDTNSFKLEECFRIFHGFYCKFRQAVGENERRRIQEEQANARRRQREELLASKRRQMENLGGTPDSDVPFIDLQIYDSRHGFPMKKGWKTTNGTSEDELSSVTGSPSLSRRRLGSFNGDPEKSPDITPNGSLRRRRSRVLSEEDEGNLMDFLRASDNNRERRSWGSLDRSWARKARGGSQRKRPALLGADFTSDRERPSSPSPLSESKPIVSTPEEENSKPKELRQKIESWLQASESDQNEETRRQTRRITNRRSFEMDSESERSSTLDTLPEGKQVYSGSQSNYRKAYPAWEPSKTIDNTDVVSAMEAVEEVQPQIKDKSAWRKSTLNVANSTEETKHDSSVRLTRHLPQVVENTNDRKTLISSLGERSPTDKLTLYIIKPNESPKTRLRDSPPSLEDQTISNKVEIDQDNIETPPATRKIFIPTPTEKREPTQPSPCRRLMGRPRDTDEPEPNPTLGDGQFDRFSAARRTRRYKRTDTDPEEPKDEPETRLKAWQDKLQNPSRRYRHQTGINQEDVKLALTKTEKIDIPRKNDDEGFEESQSLMSESPSQGASSGGNYEPDDSALVLYTKPKPIKSEPQVNKPIKTGHGRVLERGGVRRTVQETPKKSVIPRRSGSLRKTDSSSNVQRSNSRNSIVSSKSSLNSSASACTVKKMPVKGSVTKVPPPKPVKRTLSTGSTTGTRPPRPLAMSFMKPTTSSSTKVHTMGTTAKNGVFRTK